MAKSPIPADVLKSMEESGIEFDDQGNIIEDNIIVNPEDEEIEDDQEEIVEDEDLEEEDDEDEESEEEASDEEEDDEEIVEEEEDEEKNLLTPRDEEKEDNDNKAELGRLRKIEQEFEALKRRREEKEAQRNALDVDDEDNRPSRYDEEVSKFKKFREDSFAKQIKRDVNRAGYGASFEEIVNSQQWDTFLGEKVYGKTRGQHYIASIESAIEDGESDTVLEVFKEFHSRFLTGGEKKKTEEVSKKSKKSLEDLVVPNNSKSTRKSKLSKHDFVEDDYEDMLNRAQRGEITKGDFAKFDAKFQTALSKGRVKLN